MLPILKLFNSRKGDHNWQLVLLIIAVAGIFLGLMLTGKIKLLTDKSIPLCNSNLNKCACFFTTGKCPTDVTISSAQNSESCPADDVTGGCTDKIYDDLVKAAKKDKKFGTCCQGDMAKVGKSKLRG